VLAHLPAPRYRVRFALSNALGDGSVLLATVDVRDQATGRRASQSFASNETDPIECHGSAERMGANVAHALRREMFEQRRTTAAKPRRKPCRK
jgi:hypothetical protein